MTRNGQLAAIAARRGYGLIDTVGMIVIVGMLMSFAAVLLNQAYSAHSSALRHFRQTQNLQQVSERFLVDAHAAVAARGGSELFLTSSEGRLVRYTIVDDVLSRTIIEGGQEAGRESWELPAKCDAQWEVDRGNRLPTIRVTLVFESGSQGLQPIQWVARAEQLQREQSADTASLTEPTYNTNRSTGASADE